MLILFVILTSVVTDGANGRDGNSNMGNDEIQLMMVVEVQETVMAI